MGGKTTEKGQMIRIFADRYGRECLLNFNESMDFTFAKAIDEGEFKSYPTSFVFRKLCKLFSLSKDMPGCTVGEFMAQGSGVSIDLPLSYKRDRFNDIQVIELTLTDPTMNLEELKSTLKLCGWYIGDDMKVHDDRHLVLEPKYPIDTKRQEDFSKENIERWKKFYHVTPFKNKERILGMGLVPSMTMRKEFFHPERIYLFTNLMDAENFIAIHGQGDELKHLQDMNTRWVKGNPADLKYQLSDQDRKKMTIFEADLEGCLKDGRKIQLFHDSRWSEDDCTVFFTQNFIPPKYIDLKDEIGLKE